MLGLLMDSVAYYILENVAEINGVRIAVRSA